MRRLYQSLFIVWCIVVPFSLPAQTAADIAADIVRANTGGRVLSVIPSSDPNSPGFEVKVLLPDGTIQIHFVNP